MASQMWLGHARGHTQWVPCPLIGSSITRNRYVERIQFENGGGDARRSNQYQMQYDFSFSGLAHEVEGIDAFNKFAQGFWSNELIYVAHPATFETNLLSAGWASPALSERGWKPIYSGTPTYANSGTVLYGQPNRSVTYTVTNILEQPTKVFTLVIPPTHTLYFGASGTATGTAGVYIKPILASDTITYATPVQATLLGPTSSVRMNTTFNGATYQAVEIYLQKTDATASTITLNSMIAQLYLTSVTPTLPTNHYTGEGSTGMMFVDDAIVENYLYMFPPRKGISTSLAEVEAWQ